MAGSTNYIDWHLVGCQLYYVLSIIWKAMFKTQGTCSFPKITTSHMTDLKDTAYSIQIHFQWKKFDIVKVTQFWLHEFFSPCESPNLISIIYAGCIYLLKAIDIITNPPRRMWFEMEAETVRCSQILIASKISGPDLHT